MKRTVILLILVIAMLTLMLGAGSPLAKTKGFTWDAPVKAQPDGWKWH